MNLAVAIAAGAVGLLLIAGVVIGIVLLLRARRRNHASLGSSPTPDYAQPAVPYPNNPGLQQPPPPPPPSAAPDPMSDPMSGPMPPPPAKVPTAPRPHEAGPTPPASEIDRPTVIRSRSSLPVSLDPMEVPPQQTVVRPRPAPAEEPPPEDTP